MTSDLLQTGLNTLAFSRRLTDGLLRDITEEEACTIPAGCNKNCIWVTGHLAMTDDFFLSALGGQRRLQGWDPYFGMGSEPQSDASVLPAFGDVIQALAERRGAIRSAFEHMPDAALLEPMPENLRPFAETKATLMGTLAAHETFHAGQLSMVRRQLGHPSLF